MTRRPGPSALGILVAAAAFLLAVTRVEDPDAWTHLALGHQAPYGLGLALEQKGDGTRARREFAEYVRFEHRSYLSWPRHEAREGRRP